MTKTVAVWPYLHFWWRKVRVDLTESEKERLLNFFFGHVSPLIRFEEGLKVVRLHLGLDEIESVTIFEKLIVFYRSMTT